MPSLALPNRLIWFAHCPKAGGTSVEQAMVATWGEAVGHLHWGWDRWWRGGGWRTAAPPNSPQHLIWADAARSLPRAPDAVFALVRDPVARMASEYRWQRMAAARGGRRGTVAGKTLARLPFTPWLRLMLEVAAINPYAFDNHFRPQGDFIPEGAEVFRLEHGMQRVCDWLAATTGRALSVPPGHALATRAPTGVPPADAALIGQVFAADYARFGYPRPGARDAASPVDGWVRRLAPLVAALDHRGRL